MLINSCSANGIRRVTMKWHEHNLIQKSCWTPVYGKQIKHEPLQYKWDFQTNRTTLKHENSSERNKNNERPRNVSSSCPTTSTLCKFRSNYSCCHKNYMYWKIVFNTLVRQLWHNIPHFGRTHKLKVSIASTGPNLFCMKPSIWTLNTLVCFK